jgi:tetratricopeptide (TPR) repeat protein
MLIAAMACLGACSGGPGAADPNAVKVDGVTEPAPNAEMPAEFASAAEALEWGKRLLDQDDTVRAIDVLLQAVKIDPDLGEAYFHLGIAYSLVEREDQTVEAADPSSTPERTSKKPSEKKKNSEKAFESAVEAYKKILKKNEEDDAAYFYMGMAYNKLNEDEDAAKALKEAARLKPDNPEYQTELGNIYIKLAKYSEAVAALKKAIELDPDNIDAQESLEKAEAGKKRIDFNPPKKDEDKQGNSNASTGPDGGNRGNTSNSASNTRSPSANTNSRPPARPARTPSAPARTPRP